jgi:hypothetical protein
MALFKTSIRTLIAKLLRKNTQSPTLMIHAPLLTVMLGLEGFGCALLWL